MLSNQHYLIPIQKIEQEFGIISEMYTNLKKECDCLEGYREIFLDNPKKIDKVLNKKNEECDCLTLKKLELQKLNSLALTEYINDANGP